MSVEEPIYFTRQEVEELIQGDEMSEEKKLIFQQWLEHFPTAKGMNFSHEFTDEHLVVHFENA